VPAIDATAGPEPADWVSATARAAGLDDPSRHRLWEERLAAEQPLVDAVDSAVLDDRAGTVDVHTLRLRAVPSSAAGTRRGGPTSGGAPVQRGPGRISSAVDAVRAGEASVAERVEQALRVADEQAELNAFTEVLADRAREEAASLDRRLAAGEDVGPLVGVVVGVKDLMDVEGRRTTGATRALQSPRAAADARSVARLRRAGAVVVGVTNLHALAYGALGTSSDAGSVRNPLRADVVAGGSSSGSAAAVAAGIVDLALGTDTAGSIRIPATLCGIVGLKPTFGRVSLDGVHPLGPTLDHVGPLCRTVEDAALGLQALSETPFSARATDWAGLAGVTVGVSTGYFQDSLHAEVRSAFEEACDAVLQAGGRLRDVTMPTLDLVPGAQLCTLSSEAFDVHHDLLRERGGELPDDVRLRLELGMFRSAGSYVRAQRIRGVLQQEMDAALGEVDVLLTPAVAITAPSLGASEVEVEGATWTPQFGVTRLTMPFNATGHPAVSVPWSTDARGAGVGVQVAGRAMDEATVLGVARVLEGNNRLAH
jgi:Asp-tRNA(Asn)/Glu-tRNA(Gln) amidotransferase A subunit family amidase